jgi:DNA invertase Pin-like site-specific DNA recombinase
MPDQTIDCFGYVRVSSDDQYQSGAGRSAQVDAIGACANRNGWRLVKIFEEFEGVSGETPEERRPGLMDALDALRPGNVLVVAKRDRLMRDNVRIALLEAVIRKRKCRLVSAAGEGTDAVDPNDPSAFLQKSIVDLFATYELLLIRLRTRMALRAKQRRGERTGGLPYGFDLEPGDPRRSKPSNDRHGQPAGNKPIAMVENAAELQVLAWMIALKRHGWTYDRILWAMQRRNLKTKRGKPWDRSSVRFVIVRAEADTCHPVHALLRTDVTAAPSPTSSAI